MPPKKPDALQGTLDLLILKTLSHSALHGYGIAARVQQISGEALRVEEGSLYPALHRIEKAEWVAAEWQTTDNHRRARVYRLTKTGERRLVDEEARWNRLTSAVGKILRFA